MYERTVRLVDPTLRHGFGSVILRGAVLDQSSITRFCVLSPFWKPRPIVVPGTAYVRLHPCQPHDRRNKGRRPKKFPKPVTSRFSGLTKCVDRSPSDDRQPQSRPWRTVLRYRKRDTGTQDESGNLRRGPWRGFPRKGWTFEECWRQDETERSDWERTGRVRAWELEDRE